MIETERLVLRSWREADLAEFAALNADPEVMAHFPAPLTREASDALVDRLIAAQRTHGLTFWAMERRVDGAFLGMTGVVPTGADLPFGGAPEVGWRLARHAWGRGYASEAARGAMAFVFERYGSAEIVSFTAGENQRSQAVMTRIGMRRDAARDFDHPALPKGDRLRRHVVYARARP